MPQRAVGAVFYLKYTSLQKADYIILGHSLKLKMEDYL